MDTNEMSNVQVTTPAFGCNLWWTVPSNVLIDQDKVAEVLVKNGFDKDIIRPPSDRVELSRAVYSFQNRRGKTNRRIAEIAANSNDHITYGILDRSVDAAAEQVGFEQATTVKYNKSANVVEVTGALAADFTAVLPQFRDRITDADIRGFLRGVVRMCKGISKRPTGGIYFVPSQFLDVVNSAQAVLTELGTGAKLYVERIVDGVQERKIVWNAVESDIDEQIAGILASVERIEKRASALKNQESRVNELRELMGVYQTLLGQEATYQDLAAKLDVAVQTITEKMQKMQGPEALPVQNTVAMQPGVVQVDYMTAVRDILTQAGVPLHFQEIANRITSSGIAVKTPKSYLGRWFANHAAAGELRKVGTAMYELPIVQVA